MVNKNLINDYCMTLATLEAYEGIDHKHGGPFGCIIVKDNEVVGAGHNRVLIDHDPTAHGEVVAIRDACKNLGTHNLSGCTLYTTGEPCPMCLSAIMWAGIEKVYYAKSLDENSALGFNDTAFYTAVQEYFKEGKNDFVEGEHWPCHHVDKLFEKYNNSDKELY
ncbi:MAG: nucleoside deaminase [Romboutsia timonensis]